MSRLTNGAEQQAVLRLVVADDHPCILNAVTGVIQRQSDMEVVGVAQDGAAAWQLVYAQQTDVLLLDLQMPGLASTEVIRAAQELSARPHVLIVSGCVQPESVLSVLKLGVSGYWCKTENLLTLPEAIRAVARGERWISPSIAVADELNIADRTVRCHLRNILDKLGLGSRSDAIVWAVKQGL